MRTLFLHLGPAKSGSTFIQTSLELSRQRLFDAGFYYPPMPAQTMKDQGDSLFGNYGALLDLLVSQSLPARHLLISGESMHVHFQDPDTLAALDRLRRAAGFGRLSCLLLPRSPVAHASAIHQQRVKHVRATESVADYFAQYRSPEQTVYLIEQLDAMGAEVHLRSYDAARGDLVGAFESWLELASGSLTRPGRVVNRSLTRGELELQRMVNRALGPRAPRLVTPMVERLPELEPHRALPSVTQQAAMLDRLGPALVKLNDRLPDAERLSLEPIFPSAKSATYEFTAAQLQLLGEGIAAAVEQRDPFRRYRHRVAWRLAALVGRTVRGPGRRSRRPTLERSVLRVTASRGARLRTAEAAGLLVVVGALRRTVPMRRWVRLVGRPMSTSPEIPKPTQLTGQALEAAHAVLSAAQRLAFHTTCLDQAVAGSLFLRRRGVESRLVIGLNRARPGDTSHAWLIAESGAVIIGGAAVPGHVPVTAFQRSANR